MGFRLDQPPGHAQFLRARTKLFPEKRHGRHRAADPGRAEDPRALARAGAGRGVQQGLSATETDGSGYIRDKQLQALKLLAEAGWHPKDNKLVNAAGEPMVFSFLDGQGGFDRLILPFKRTLAQIGITLDFLRIDSAQYINRLNARDYDMIVVSLPKNGNPIISPAVSCTTCMARKAPPKWAAPTPWCCAILPWTR